MQSIKLNFQQAQNPVWKKLGRLLVIAGLGLNIFLFIEHQHVLNEIEGYVSKLDDISHPVKTKLVAKGTEQDLALKKRLEEADNVIKQLNMPWSALFNHLEATRETNINLLEFTPNVQSKEVLLVGQAENLKAVFDYMARLKKTQLFTRVELNSHEKTPTIIGANALRFSILAKWQTDDK